MRLLAVSDQLAAPHYQLEREPASMWEVPFSGRAISKHLVNYNSVFGSM